jgi:hypothetical protein
MVKIKRTKDRQYNGQKKKDEGQTTQWSKEKGRRTDNTMVKRKRANFFINKTLHRKLHSEQHELH